MVGLIIVLLLASFLVPQLWLGEEYGARLGMIAVLISCVLGFVLSAATLRNSILRSMRPWLVATAFILLATVTLSVVYPIANARNTMGGGSDSDEAIQIAVQRLLSGLPPYAEATYLGNPITPMPGTLIMYSPAQLAFGSVVWMAPVLLGFTFLLLGKADGKSLKAIVVALLLSPLFWHNFVTGADYILTAILAFAASAYLIVSMSHPGRLLVAVVLGLACASRPTMLLFPFALLLLEGARGRSRRAVFTATIVGLTVVLVTLPVYLWEPESFTPFHFFWKTGGAGSGVIAVILALVWQLLIFALIRVRKLSPPLAVSGLALLLAPAGLLLVIPPALSYSPFMLYYASFTSMLSPLAVPAALALCRTGTDSLILDAR